MQFRHFQHVLLLGAAVLSVAVPGCGTTKWSDTARTGTEQLLISQAIDRAIEKIDFGILRGKSVFLNTEAICEAVDFQYLRTTIRQHVAASGALLRDKPEDCEYILEVRSGAVGTDRNDVLVGIPSMQVPYVSGEVFSTAQVPEIPLIKKTDQRAVVKIAVFAYDRESGHPLWASGNQMAESRAKAWWVFGAGPINKGTLYPEAHFAGDKFYFSRYWQRNSDVDPASFPLYFESSEDKTASREEESDGATAVAPEGSAPPESSSPARPRVFSQPSQPIPPAQPIQPAQPIATPGIRTPMPGPVLAPPVSPSNPGNNTAKSAGIWLIPPK
ncbi:MAG TPA: hypothetical protein DEB39_15480 [Planctomycetaceae bacterium]|nr:hypothetical protein [Planctomycetaceae bacterium]